MLRSVVRLCEEELGAIDGEVGHVNDFYFDEQDWTIRYMVADMKAHKPGRLVLIARDAFKDLYQGGKLLKVNLSRHELDARPCIESKATVSRPFEADYRRYYDWALYWQKEPVRGVSDCPATLSLGEVSVSDAILNEKQGPKSSRLRSVKATFGHRILGTDDAYGRVTDFVMDDKNWSIKRLVVEVGNWDSAKKVLISPAHITRTNWDESKVYVELNKEEMSRAPVFDNASFGILENSLRMS